MRPCIAAALTVAAVVPWGMFIRLGIRVSSRRKDSARCRRVRLCPKTPKRYL